MHAYADPMKPLRVGERHAKLDFQIKISRLY